MQKHRKTYCNFRITRVTGVAKQIQHHHSRKLTGSEAGLVAYLDFDEASGQVAVDRSGNNNHGYFGSTFMTESSDPQRSQSAAVLASYSAELVSATDYYPNACPEQSRRSMEMPERGFSASAYRYGFNGKEKDEEGMGGGGTTYDYGFRIYNPSIAKFLSVDPLTSSYPWYTPYQFAGNKPIYAVDIDGLEELPNPIYEEGKRMGIALLKKATEYLIKKTVEYLLPDTDEPFDDSEDEGTDKEEVEKDNPTLTLNNPKTPKSAYVSVKADIKAGAHKRENATLLGLGKKLELGVSEEIASIEWVGNGDEAYLNIQIVNTDPKATAKIKKGAIGGGYTMTIPLNPISDTDKSKGSVSFTVGAFQFNVPLDPNKSPTMQINLLEEAHTNGSKTISTSFTVTIKNIEILTTKEVTEDFKASNNQIRNSYHQVKARECAAQKQTKKE